MEFGYLRLYIWEKESRGLWNAHLALDGGVRIIIIWWGYTHPRNIRKKRKSDAYWPCQGTLTHPGGIREKKRGETIEREREECQRLRIFLFFPPFP